MLACAAYGFSSVGVCPASGGSCAALIRPSLSRIGPVPVALIGVLGAALTFAIALAAARGALTSRRAALVAVAIPGLGAGFVFGLQAWPLTAGAGLCPVCLAVAVSAAAAAAAIAASTEASAPEDAPVRGTIAASFGFALLATLPVATLAGNRTRAGDALARVHLAGLSQAAREVAPLLVVVERPGCPYCEALELDVLGREPVVSLIRERYRLRFVREDDPLAKEHAGGKGAPVLIAFDADGKARGRLRGYRSPDEVAAWLESLPE